MSIEWKDEYKTGFGKLDSQHKRLFDCVNEMDEILSAREISRSRVKILTDFLTSYVKAHFIVEEICMAKHNCPVANQNKEAHDGFLKFYNEALDDYHREGPTRPWLQKLHDVARDWLIQHICKVDIHLRACATRAGEDS